MAQLPATVCVLGPQYMVPSPMDIIFIRKDPFLGSGSLVVTDINYKMMFVIKNCETYIHERQVLVDAANIERPIATLQDKIRTAHSRWEVFRGDSTDDTNLIFSCKTPHVVQLRTKLNVYLSGNNDKDSCDFRLEGSWSDRSCTIYHGNSSTIIAQMHQQHPTENKKLGKDKFVVTISPNVDYAFVVVIFSILNTLKTCRMDSITTTEVVSIAINIAALGTL